MRRATITLDKSHKSKKFTITGNIIEGIGSVLVTALRGIKGEVELDFSGVTITNSLGIKEWMQALPELPDVRIKMTNCPAAIVHTINMIPNFIGNGTVGSVIGVFACANCDASKSHTIIIGQDIDPIDLTLKLKLSCDECGHNSMHLEVGVEEYFEFLEGA